VADRTSQAADAPKSAAGAAAAKAPVAPFIAVVDEEQVCAAVTVALDASMAAMVDEITKRVLAALASKKPEGASVPASKPSVAPAIQAAQPAPIPPPEPAAPKIEPVRRVTPVRLRSSSILGLDVGPRDPES